jgi:hypothetical protein
MRPDIVIGERRVGDRVFDRGHVAGDTAPSRVDWTYRVCQSRKRVCRPCPVQSTFRLTTGRVTVQASGLVVPGRRHGVSMRIVAGHTIELVLTFGETSAPGQGRSLESDGRRVLWHDFPTARAVALTAQLHHLHPGSHCGINDRPVWKPQVDRPKVVASGTVTLLAANSSVGRTGPGVIEDRSGTCDMAKETATDAVIVERPSQ